MKSTFPDTPASLPAVPDDYRLTSTGCGFSLIKKSHAATNARRHFHPWWELLYIAEGDRTFFYANRTLHIGAGTFLCIAPGILHRAVNPAGEVCKLYNVYFADSEEPLSAEDARFSALLPVLEDCEPCVTLRPEMHASIRRLFAHLGQELLAKGRGWQNMAWALLTEIIVMVSRPESAAISAVERAPEMSAGLASLIDWLNAHYTEEVTLSRVSEQFGISASHVSRSFKAATHFGFVEYVNSLRVTEACRLLTGSRLSVLEIAMQCGFGSLTQFGRVFRSLTGTNPLDYRMQNKVEKSEKLM
ncbi:MAG: AraC family transcriptional regulator [Treponema sp.]|nr:AraC family transcriptional regulator [Treponema sp.]